MEELRLTVLVGGWLALASGCGGAQVREAEPNAEVAPDEFVLRDVRKDAARYLGCQVPMVTVEIGPWAGSGGNVTAYGCGLRLTYYLRCQTSHLCQFSISD